MRCTTSRKSHAARRRSSRLGMTMRRIAAALIAVTLAATAASAQRRGRFGFGPSVPENPQYDGAFQFCRIAFRNAANGDGGGWWVDYPRADENLTFRLSELTTTPVSDNGPHAYNHAVLRLTDVLNLSRCPFTMITEPASLVTTRAVSMTPKTDASRRCVISRCCSACFRTSTSRFRSSSACLLAVTSWKKMASPLVLG